MGFLFNSRALFVMCILPTGIALSLPKQCHCPTLNLDSSVHVEPETSHLTYTAGEHVSIYCSDSKYLTPTGLPPIVTVCQDNCTWSQDVSHIQCIERQCPAIEETDLPANVTVQYVHLPESGLPECGTLAAFGCARGMELHSGPHFWQCSCDGSGNWSSTELPTCQAKTCDALHPPANAHCQRTDESNDIGTIAECSCGPEFESVNGTSGLFVCEYDEEDHVDWVGDLECVRKHHPESCYQPPPQPHRITIAPVRGPSYPVGTLLKYVCMPGRLIVGKNVIMCNESGQWWPEAPSCTLVECRNPEVTDPRVIVVSPPDQHYIYGNQVKYTCPSGYHRLGSARRRCIGPNQWSGHQPQCKKLCPDPGIPIGSSRNIHGTFYEGNEIFYQCDKGKRLVGERRLTCLSNGRWTSNIPSCPHIECPRPNVRDPRVIQKSEKYASYWFHQDIEYTCPSGYQLLGSKQRKCLKRGWSGQEPRCKKSE